MQHNTSPDIRHSPRTHDEVSDGVDDHPPLAETLIAALSDTGVEPQRLRGDEAKTAFRQDGAVVLPGIPIAVGSLAISAAEIWGDRLRRLFPVRHRGSDGEGVLKPHTDTFHVIHDIHGDLRPERHPDEDILVMQLTREPKTGGHSKVVDAYRLIDLLKRHDPELHQFVTTSEVDILGAWRDLPGVPDATRAGLVVEHTRRGRRAVRLGAGITPLLRSTDYNKESQLLARFHHVSNCAASISPPIQLAAGDVLVVDNYRCLHGRDAFTGPRHLAVQTGMSSDAF